MRMIGQTVSHYHILEKVGEGGMGVVYKARDTHLERFVAIKVLPPERVADPERKRRFIQEARAASALNHPNIITVHDIAREKDLDFMVLEFVAGKTLAELTPRKGLKLSEALKYAVQIADALAAAHAAGIVHRDLKPSNVMVGENGVVKVLDFGLAKLAELATGDLAPTQTALTKEGSVLGTPAYMSPEQAEGKNVDPRSDIFSFGAVLYETMTGRRAFPGESRAATLAAILHQDPEPVSEFREDIPAELEKLITRCLRKDPQRRAQSMADLKLALEELKEEFDSGKGPVVQPRLAARSLPRWVLATLAVVAAGAAGVMWWLTRAPSVSAPPLLTLTRLTSDSGLTTDPALSPDGRLLAYASDRAGEGNLDIYVRQVGGGEPLRLTRDPADERQPAFSPDGTMVAFRSEKDGGGIYVVSALGGPPRRLAPEGRNPQFSPDGSWITYWVGLGGVEGAWLSIRGGCRIYVVPSAGGPPRQLQPDFVGAAHPVWSPDGKHLLFLGNRDEKLPPDEATDWWITPLDPGPATRTAALEATRKAKLAGPLLAYSSALLPSAWQSPGDSLVFSARSGDTTNLWRIGISPETWKVTGPPERLTSGPTLEESPAVVSGPGGAARVAFASITENLDIWSLPIEGNQGKVMGELKRLTQDTAADLQPALSPDGSKMVFISARSGSQEVWIRDLRSGEAFVLTATRTPKYATLFSPDGSKVAFAEAGTWDTYLVPSGGGAPEMVCEGCGQPTGWSSDGKFILANSTHGRLWLLELASGGKTDLFPQSKHWLCCGRFSPDDRWISFWDGTVGHAYVAPFRVESPIEERELIDVTDGNGYWSPDGQLLYHGSNRDGYLCIWAQRLDPAKRPVEAPLPVFHSHNARISLANQNEWALAIGRDTMLFNMGERTSNIWLAEWKER